MITSEEPKVTQTGRYSAADTARILGIHRHTLEKYTNSSLIKFGIRRANGRKFYLGSEILRFWRAQA